MTWGLVAIAGATLIGTGTMAAVGSSAAHDAADAQKAGADEGVQVQREGLAQQQSQFNQQQANLQPWLDTGKNALSTLYDSVVGGSGASKFQASPGYDFAVSQGERAVNANASARGMSMSGNRLKDLTTFGQGEANQEYGNWLNQLGTLAGFGQTANNTSANIASNNSAAIGNNANALSNLYGNAAAASASGYVGGANATTGAISGGLNNLTSLYGMSQSGYGLPKNFDTQYSGIGGGIT